MTPESALQAKAAPAPTAEPATAIATADKAVKVNPLRYKSKLKPVWCPGCGDFAVLNAMYRAFAEQDIDPDDLLVVSGIGCSGRLPGYLTTYGFNSIHGRALPVSTGARLSSLDKKVVVTGGDGDGFSIGIGHFIHAARRNVDLTYVVMDNMVYGLTKGQFSPTSEHNNVSKSSLYGSIDNPLDIVQTALHAGASFVARGFSGNLNQMVDLIKQGMNHKGFAVVTIFSPCVTFRGMDEYKTYKEHSYTLPAEYDPSNREAALKVAREHTPAPLGVIWKQERPTYEDGILALRQRAAPKGQLTIGALLDQYMP